MLKAEEELLKKLKSGDALSDDELEDISTEDLTEVDSSLRSLLRDAWYHRTLQYVHKEKKQAKETGNPYSWVFHTIYHIIENMP